MPTARAHTPASHLNGRRLLKAAGCTCCERGTLACELQLWSHHPFRGKQQAISHCADLYEVPEVHLACNRAARVGQECSEAGRHGDTSSVASTTWSRHLAAAACT